MSGEVNPKVFSCYVLPLDFLAACVCSEGALRDDIKEARRSPWKIFSFRVFGDNGAPIASNTFTCSSIEENQSGYPAHTELTAQFLLESKKLKKRYKSS